MLARLELGRQQMPAAEHIERQVAVAVVVAVEEPSLLVAVQRVVGGVEIEHDLLRRLRVRVEEEVHEQRLDRRAVVGDPAVAVGFRRAMLQPVQRALASERRAAPVPRLEPTKHHPEHRVVTQPVVVDQVLVAERDAEHPLPDQRRHLVDHPLRRPAIREAGREALDEPDRPVGRSEQQPAGVWVVIAPPPKSTITARPATRANPIGFALHSVGIGELSCWDRSPCCRSTLPPSGPRCTYPWCEMRAKVTPKARPASQCDQPLRGSGTGSGRHANTGGAPLHAVSARRVHGYSRDVRHSSRTAGPRHTLPRQPALRVNGTICTAGRFVRYFRALMEKLQEEESMRIAFVIAILGLGACTTVEAPPDPVVVTSRGRQPPSSCRPSRSRSCPQIAPSFPCSDRSPSFYWVMLHLGLHRLDGQRLPPDGDAGGAKR